MVAAELATAYPQNGGIYVWVREAFGRRAAFITIWLQWIYNVVWYPTILAFIAATLAYLFAPELANNRYYLWGTIVSLFWLFTFLNCFGMKVSSLISILGATLGTIAPMVGITILGVIWLIQGNPIQNVPSSTWLPDFSSVGNLSIFSAVLFGLLGMEMSAIHAEEVNDPQRDYPRALAYSTIIIFSTLVLGSLAIVIVVRKDALSVVSGFIDAYAIFFNAYNMPWMTPVTAGLVILGGVSCMAAWIIGPTKALLVSAHDGCLPRQFSHKNRHGAPTVILMTQGVIFTMLSTVIIFVESLNAAYWILSDMCAQLALLAYMFMFASAIKLRYSRPDQHRAYKIPGGNWGMWAVAGIGFLCCLVTILIGFVPPTQIPIDNVAFFESFLIGGMLLFVLIPWVLAKRNEKPLI